MAKSTGLTTGSVSVGTSGYQAKEIIAGHSPTRSSDVYAMAGVILAVGVTQVVCRDMLIDVCWLSSDCERTWTIF